MPSCTCLRKYSIARGWVCVGYPIPCLGKSEAPFCLGGGLALCVSAGSCGGVVVFDLVTRFCLGGCAASFFLLVPVIVGIVLDRVTRFCLGVGDASFPFLASVFVGAVGLDWFGCLISRLGSCFLFGLTCPPSGVEFVVGELFFVGSCCSSALFGPFPFLFLAVVLDGDACLFLVGVCCFLPVFRFVLFSLLGLLLPGIVPSPS